MIPGRWCVWYFVSIFQPHSSFFPPKFVDLPLFKCWSKVKGNSNLHSDASALWCPGSIEVWQHLGQPVRVNSLADMTCPAPVIELLAICRPWLSCCHIIVNLGVTVVHHVLIRWDGHSGTFCGNNWIFSVADCEFCYRQCLQSTKVEFIMSSSHKIMVV